MPFKTLESAMHETRKIISSSLRILKEHPELTLYPYVATLFISITYPLVGASIFAQWYGKIFYEAGVYVPHKAGLILGLVGFSVFYAALVSAYFSCAVTATVIAKMDNKPTPPLHGFGKVLKRFGRVTRFALLSVFFFPIGIYAQRKRLPGGWLAVIGSSLTLRMAQVAPAVLGSDKNVGETIRESVNVMGRAWRPSLVLKILMYLVIFLIVVLPKLAQKGLFKSPTAASLGWIVSLELAVSGLVGIKVLTSIFTAVMYHQAQQKNT